MRRYLVFPTAFVVVAAVAAVIGVVACRTDYQQNTADRTYEWSNPGQKPAGPTSELLAASSAAASGGAIGPVCVQAGKTLLDAGATCAVSFKADVIPALNTGLCSSAACHGGVSPLNQPRIEATADVADLYTGFAAFKLSTGLPLINPCSTDPAESAMVCNVDAKNKCGVVMPSGGNGLSDDVLAKLTTWAQCGSPNN